MLSDTCPLIVRGLVSLNLDSYSDFCTLSCCSYYNLSCAVMVGLSACFGWWETVLFLVKLAAFFGLAYQWLISGLSIASTSVFRLYVCLIPLDGCAPSSAVNSSLLLAATGVTYSLPTI